MWVLEGSCWGWTELPGLLAWEKGKRGETLGFRASSAELRGFGKAALVLLSSK